MEYKEIKLKAFFKNGKINFKLKAHGVEWKLVESKKASAKDGTYNVFYRPVSLNQIFSEKAKWIKTGKDEDILLVLEKIRYKHYDFSDEKMA